MPIPSAKIRAILERVKTIALVGASANWNRPSYFVMKYLQGKGYRVIPVDPGDSGEDAAWRAAYASLREIPDKVDMVDICAGPEDAPPIVEDAIAIGAKVVWMQLGVRNRSPAAKIAEAAGLEVIMNRCPKIEFGRLGGELSWSGVDSGIIPEPPTRRPVATPGQDPLGAVAQSRLRLRVPRHPCRRRARSDHGRAFDPDLSDDGLCVSDATTPPRSSTCTISATSIRGSPIRPCLCWKSASRRSRAVAPRSPPRQAMRRSS